MEVNLLDLIWYFYNYKNMKKDEINQQAIDAIASTFAALGQSSRLQIVRLLLAAHPQGLPAGEIQQELGIAAPTLSHHLDKLRQVGVLETTRDRQWIWYRVRPDALKQLIEFLFEECCTRNQVVVLPEDRIDDCTSADPTAP